jgi:polar amino acid transport system substrate-binding protein
MKVTCSFQNQDWDGIIPSLLADKFDVIMSSMNITEARKQKVIFTQPYYASAILMIGLADYKGSDFSPAALKGKLIGTQSSTIHANWLEKYYGQSEIKLYPTQDEPNLDLAGGRLDFVVGDGLVEETFIKEKGNGCCRVIGEVQRDPAIHGPGVGAAFRPADTDLRDMFDKAIAESYADGSFHTLEMKYFPTSIMIKH